MVPINYLAVFAATIAAFLFSWLWYGLVFGKTWMNLMGFTPESIRAMKMTPLKAMVGGFIANLAMAYVLAHPIFFASAYLNVSGLNAGLQGAFWNWLGFVGPISAGSVLWEGRSWKLWFFNSGHNIIMLAIMGVIIALWK